MKILLIRLVSLFLIMSLFVACKKNKTTNGFKDTIILSKLTIADTLNGDKTPPVFSGSHQICKEETDNYTIALPHIIDNATEKNQILVKIVEATNDNYLKLEHLDRLKTIAEFKVAFNRFTFQTNRNTFLGVVAKDASGNLSLYGFGVWLDMIRSCTDTPIVSLPTPPQDQGSSTPPQDQGSSTPPQDQGSSTPPQDQGSSTPPQDQGSSTPPQDQGSSTIPNPTANNDTAQTTQNTSTIINVLFNDLSNVSGSTIKINSIDKTQTLGVISQNTDGTISYQSKLNFVGLDTFGYTISNTEGKISAPAIVTITINCPTGYGQINNQCIADTPPTPQENPAPIAMDDTATTKQNTSVNINVLANDIVNDEISNGTKIKIHSIIKTSTTGTIYQNSDGSISYQAKSNFVGLDTFGYTISNTEGKISSSALVTITIDCPTGYLNENNTCIREPLVCSDGKHFNSLDYRCDSDRISCPINGGTGYQEWNSGTNSYSSCILEKCDLPFVQYQSECRIKVCEADQTKIFTCKPDPHGLGTYTAKCYEQIEWKPITICTLTGCESGYYASGNQCLSLNSVLLVFVCE